MLVTHLHYHRISKTLDIRFDDNAQYSLSAEFLRVLSPSAEVQGHGQKEPNLVANKRDVGISRLEPVGHYAVRLCFDDGHQSGLYSFDYLAHLCCNKSNLWQDYLERLKRANATRESAIAVNISF